MFTSLTGPALQGSLLLLSAVLAQAAPAPQTNISVDLFADSRGNVPLVVGGAYGRAKDFDLSVTFPVDNKFKLRYRDPGADEGQIDLTAANVVAAATCFRKVLADLHAKGRDWDSPLGGKDSSERSVTWSRVNIWIKSHVFMRFEVTLERADGLMQTIIAAANAQPVGFTHEAYIDTFLYIEEQAYVLAPVNMFRQRSRDPGPAICYQDGQALGEGGETGAGEGTAIDNVLTA